jgi:hypothetical protein
MSKEEGIFLENPLEDFEAVNMIFFWRKRRSCTINPEEIIEKASEEKSYLIKKIKSLCILLKQESKIDDLIFRI